MPCKNNSSCVPTLSNITLGVGTFEPQSSQNVSTKPDTNQSREAFVSFSHGELVFVLLVAALAVFLNGLVLFMTRFASGGQSPTMVFVRMLCVSDLLVGSYGVGKMLMFLYVDNLMINFFLPESLLFTANTAACLSLLALNLDRSVKVCAPLWYSSNMDKPSIITGMVFLANVSFVVGFLPLLGWSLTQRHIYQFFDFFPWTYLLFVGLLWLTCVCGSVAILVYVRHRFDLTLSDHRHLTYHLAEVEKYCKLRVTLVVDVVTWCLCYVPFLLFLGLACRTCPFGGRPDFNSSVYHFTSVLMLRAIVGAATQAYRTVHIQGLVKLRRWGSCGSSSSPVNHHHHRNHSSRTCSRGPNGVTTISYSNPMCDASVTDLSVIEDIVSVHCDGHDVGAGPSRRVSTDSQTRGITNLAYRPSLETLNLGPIVDFSQGVRGVTEENTAL